MPRSVRTRLFADRADAGRRLGRRLGRHLTPLKGQPVVVLGLPRGGIPVAEQVARALDAPLDVLMVRKVGVPFQPELAMAAVGEGGVTVRNEEVLRATRVPPSQLEAGETQAREVLSLRGEVYRRGRGRAALKDRIAVIVDDGIATGSTARAACLVARAAGAARVILAVPVAPPDAAAELADAADEFVCLEAPADFVAVGQAYADFRQVGDETVTACLDRARGPAVAPRPRHREPDEGVGHDALAVHEEIVIPIDAVTLTGRLEVPPQPRAVVIFAHGSGSSRHSPRNRYVASALHGDGLATLLFDLLTGAEEGDRSKVFNVGLLSERLIAATSWVAAHERLGRLPICYFGASTGAAAALCAAADDRTDVAAVVSRGGRVDLAAPCLPGVRAATLLIVGEHDRVVLDLNRRAQQHMVAETGLLVIAGAGHLFEEPGTLADVAAAAGRWLTAHCGLRQGR